MGKRFTRLDGESMPQFQARIAAVQSAERVVRVAVRYRRKRFTQQAQTLRVDQRNADHVDGYDRDDIGLSPDY